MLDYIIIVAVCVFVIVGVIYFMSVMKEIEKNGEEVEGIVFDYENSGDIKSNSVYPVIRFVIKDGTWMTETYQIGAIPGLLKKGQKVKVVYDVNKPSRFFIKSPYTYIILSMLFITPLGVIIFAAIKLFYLFKLQ